MIKNLPNIQNEMNVQKSRFNNFGGYKYRSCEDILQEAKRVCEKYGCYVMVTDSIEFIEGRFYVKATAKIVETETGFIETCSAFAREEDSKKGMDLAQLTGATSSYARKYALCGLFAIDDSIDSDSMNGEPETKEKRQKTASKQAANPGNTGSNSNYLGGLIFDFFFFQAEDGIGVFRLSGGLGDVKKRHSGGFLKRTACMDA